MSGVEEIILPRIPPTSLRGIVNVRTSPDVSSVIDVIGKETLSALQQAGTPVPGIIGVDGTNLHLSLHQWLQILWFTDTGD